MSETQRTHLDVIGVLGGGEQFMIGHEDVDWIVDGNPATTYHQLSSVLMELAWQIHDRAVRFESFVPRAFVARTGLTYFEVDPDLFVAGWDLENARQAFLSGNKAAGLDDLQDFYGGELREVEL